MIHVGYDSKVAYLVLVVDYLESLGSCLESGHSLLSSVPNLKWLRTFSGVEAHPSQFWDD
jgi:hypothetical protein